MHPFILVPLLASFAAMYPVGASPLVYSAPVPVPVVGDTNVGLVSGMLPDMSLPFRRDLGDMKGPMPVIGFGADPPPPEPTTTTQARRDILDPTQARNQRASRRPSPKAQSGQTSSDTGALSGLPAGVPSSTLPLGATSPGGNSSPLGSTTSLLSALPLGQAGGATGTTSGATSDVPESPATPFTEEAQDEPAELENSQTDEGLSEVQPSTAQKSGTGHAKANQGSTFNPNHSAYKHSSSSAHQAPPPVQRRAMTTYYRSVNSRSVLDNKAHSLIVDTDPMAPPPNPGPDYDPTIGLMNVDSNAKPKAPTKAETAKTQQAPVEAPKNATSPAS